MQSEILKSENRRPCVINMHDDIEVHHWSQVFNVTPEILRKAARYTQSSALDVLEKYLEINKEFLISNSSSQNASE